MITSKEYSSKIKKYDIDELIEERKKLLSSIEYLEKTNFKKNIDIYTIKLEYLIECIKLIKKKKDSLEDNNTDELHDGDTVKINNKEYKISIVVDKKAEVKELEDTIEIHVTYRKVDDYKYIKKIFDRYKKNSK